MPSPTHVLRMESLERRDTPSGTAAVGARWADATALTLSFAPDGTAVGREKSDLFALMKSAGKSGDWQREVLRAFQTWAAETNANVAVVPDGGQAFGTTGDRQGDNRFGDIRVGSVPQSDGAVAQAVAPDPGVGTWSGDVLFNARRRFAVRPATPADGYDVYSTALHEAGHVFGLGHSADPASAVSEQYTRVKPGLTAGDAAGVRAIYGPRAADKYEGANGNDTFATATALTPGLYQAIVGDLSAAGDADVFTFTVPAFALGSSVTLRTAGISSVAAAVEVYDSTGKLVARSGAADPLHPKDLKLSLPTAFTAAKYFARVVSPNADVFAVGRYMLALNVDWAKANKSALAALDLGQNDTLAGAEQLPALGSSSERFRTDARLDRKGDVDVYAVTAPVVPSDDALLIEVRNLRGDHAVPDVRVFDAAGRPLVAQVLESTATKTTLQVLGVSRGAAYFLAVRSPDGKDATGDYRLSADFTDPVARGLTQLDSGVLSSYVDQAEGTLTLDSAQLVQLSLNVSAQSPADAAVSLQVFDDKNKLLGEWAVNPLTGQVNGSLLLDAGTYRVVVSVHGKKGQTAVPVRYWLFGGVSSDPIGPTAPSTSTLPNSPPPPPPPPPVYTSTGKTSSVPVGYPYKS